MALTATTVLTRTMKSINNFFLWFEMFTFVKINKITSAFVMLPTQILQAIDSGDTSKAIDLLNNHLVSSPGDDEAWYTLGRLYWKAGQQGAAVTAYRHAVDINPKSPARHALELANDVLDFFNPDLLNP